MVSALSHRLGFVLLFAAGFVFSACENDLEKVNVLYSPKRLPVESVRNTEILYTDSGQLVGRLKSPQMDHYLGERSFTVMPKGVVLFLYDSAGKVTTRMKARFALKYDDRDVVEAKGGVEVVNERGERLETEHLIWDQRGDAIRSDVFVRITTQQEVLLGEGLTSNQSFTRYRILKPRGTVKLKDPLVNP